MSSTSIYALLQHPNVKSSLAERYINFIESCTCDETEYHEDHHVLPSSIYSSYSNLRKNKWNCKTLSARQHFIAHCMLARMFLKNTPEFFSMVKAFNMMCTSHNESTQNRYVNSRLYEQNRKHMSETMRYHQTGRKNSQSGTCWVTSPEMNIKKKIKVELINEYYEQGWFISRANPILNLFCKCQECDKQIYLQHRKAKPKFCDECRNRMFLVNVNKSTGAKKKLVDCDGNTYGSVSEAATAYGVSTETIRKGIHANKFHTIQNSTN